jgi:hypothetical protein
MPTLPTRKETLDLADGLAEGSRTLIAADNVEPSQEATGTQEDDQRSGLKFNHLGR